MTRYSDEIKRYLLWRYAVQDVRILETTRRRREGAERDVCLSLCHHREANERVRAGREVRMPENESAQAEELARNGGRSHST